MCHLSLSVDQSAEPVGAILAAVNDAGLYLRGVRLIPAAGSLEADLQLSLGGGSADQFEELLRVVEKVPGVLSSRRNASDAT